MSAFYHSSTESHSADQFAMLVFCCCLPTAPSQRHTCISAPPSLASESCPSFSLPLSGLGVFPLISLIEFDTELLMLRPGVCTGVCPVASDLAFTPFWPNDPCPGVVWPSREGGTALPCA